MSTKYLNLDINHNDGRVKMQGYNHLTMCYVDIQVWLDNTHSALSEHENCNRNVTKSNLSSYLFHMNLN